MGDAILPPMLDDIGVAVIRHGERGRGLDPINPDACLCGRYLDYMQCPEDDMAHLTLYPTGEKRP